ERKWKEGLRGTWVPPHPSTRLASAAVARMGTTVCSTSVAAPAVPMSKRNSPAPARPGRKRRSGEPSKAPGTSPPHAPGREGGGGGAVEGAVPLRPARETRGADRREVLGPQARPQPPRANALDAEALAGHRRTRERRAQDLSAALAFGPVERNQLHRALPGLLSVGLEAGAAARLVLPRA